MVILGVENSYKVPTMFYSVISVYVLNLMTIGFILAIVLDAFSTNFSAHKFYYNHGYVPKGFHFVKFI